MLALVFATAILMQQDDGVKLAHSELDKTIAKFAGREEKFTLGAARECIHQIQMAAEAFDRGGRPKEAVAIYDGAVERISKAISGAEMKTPELRKLQGHLEKGRRRAAALEDDARKAAAYRYGLERGVMVWAAEVNLAGDLMNLSLSCIQAGDLEEALDALREVEDRLAPLRQSTFEATPQSVRMPPMIRARIYSMQGKWKDAAGELRRGLDILPEFLGQDLEFKKLHRKPEDYDKLLKQLETRGEDDPDARLLHGFEVYFSEGRDKSRAIFKKILEKSPEDKAAKVFLAKLDE